MIPHSIRLRHPWDHSPAESGRIAYFRRFNRPTNLDEWERVTLEIDRAMFHGDVFLNDKNVGQLAVGEFFSSDVTPLLKAVNELRVEVDPATMPPTVPPTSTIYVVDPNDPPGSPIGDVRLVIRSTSTPV